MYYICHVKKQLLLSRFYSISSNSLKEYVLIFQKYVLTDNK